MSCTRPLRIAGYGLWQLLVSGVLLMPSPSRHTPTELPSRPIVLFVCVENSNRSQMAEAFAKIHGGDKIESYSAGSRPSGQINPRATQFMKELGYDLSEHISKPIEQFNGLVVDVAVTMGCGDKCPLVMAKRREAWQIPDPKDMSPEQYREVRGLIEQKVQALLREIGLRGESIEVLRG